MNAPWRAFAIGVLACCAFASQAQGPRLDLTTEAGLTAVHGTWRYHDAALVETAFPAPDASGDPRGPTQTTYEVMPAAGKAGFDDSQWARVAPTSLAARRGNGRVSFGWYRLAFTVPDQLAGVPTEGCTLSFGVIVDDYAEIWVDGEIAHRAGQRGGAVVAGWNAPNVVRIADDVRPGRKVEIAVFAINGPISRAPTNFHFVRAAWLELRGKSATPHAVVPTEVNVEVTRRDPALDRLVSRNPKLFKIAEGFQFTEGPVWRGDALLFSDPNANRIYTWHPQRGVTVFREHSGYAGSDVAAYRQPGSNGLALDPEGRLTVNEHGNRRITRTEPDGRETVLADRLDGKRLNSPNDLVYRADGTLYFTDPPFGLPLLADDPRRELSVAGIYRVVQGRVELLAADLAGPNGIAFSPDERFLYVGNWDPARKVVMRYPVQPDGRLGRGSVFFDMTNAEGDDAIDGIKVDLQGNLYVSGPGGLWILDANGRHLGTVNAPRQIHNLAWGEDGHALFLTAHDRLYRMPLLAMGRTATGEAHP